MLNKIIIFKAVAFADRFLQVVNSKTWWQITFKFLRKLLLFMRVQLFLKFLYILSYPCGYHSNNLLLIISIVIAASGAYLVRIFGFYYIFTALIDISPFYLLSSVIGGYCLYTLVIFSSIYLKFLISTKIHYLLKYANSINISNLFNRISYIIKIYYFS